MIDPRDLTHRLKGRWHGKEGTARCPAHDDHSPSLSIGVGADGKTLVHCHAGCSQAQVIDALRAMGLWDSAATNPRDSNGKDEQRNANGEHAIRIWKECVPTAGTPIETYLASRGITFRSQTACASIQR